MRAKIYGPAGSYPVSLLRLLCNFGYVMAYQWQTFPAFGAQSFARMAMRRCLLRGTSAIPQFLAKHALRFWDDGKVKYNAIGERVLMTRHIVARERESVCKLMGLFEIYIRAAVACVILCVYGRGAKMRLCYECGGLCMGSWWKWSLGN